MCSNDLISINFLDILGNLVQVNLLKALIHSHTSGNEVAEVSKNEGGYVIGPPHAPPFC
jgi:hypothetical protein